jgi:ABC-type nitrate/sulfonate/bicarbonate transport system permease component
MATTFSTATVQDIPRRRPIERPIGWDGFKARYGILTITIINVACFFILWEVIARMGVVSRLLLPPISEVVTETIEMAEDGTLWKNLSFSATNFTLGFLIASATGIPLGLMLGASKKLDIILGPYVWAFFSTPRLALLPLITVALGFGMASKVFLVFIGAFFVIVINTWAGVKTVEQSLVHAGRVFGANRVQIFSKIVVPYTLPFIVVGLRLGVTRALVVTVVAEMLASSRGMGYVIVRAVDAFNSARLFSMIVILVIVSMILVTGLRKLEEWVAPWRTKGSV